MYEGDSVGSSLGVKDGAKETSTLSKEGLWLESLDGLEETELGIILNAFRSVGR